jgi:hypothetical protein
MSGKLSNLDPVLCLRCVFAHEHVSDQMFAPPVNTSLNGWPGALCDSKIAQIRFASLALPPMNCIPVAYLSPSRGTITPHVRVRTWPRV